MSMETKALKPILHVGKPPTSPPPAKLLINHGKPNFTIQKTSKSKLNHVGKDQIDNEFSRVHQKINRSISNEKSPKQNYTNEVDFFTQVKLKPVSIPNGVAQQQQMKVSKAYSYGTIDRNRVMTVKVSENVTNGDAHGQLKSPPIKPEIKAKPPNLLSKAHHITPVQPPSPQPPVSNRNGIFEPHSIPAPPPPPPPPPAVQKTTFSTNLRNGNFEPKTVVSFSKDLTDGVNRYPETVKVVKPSPDLTPSDIAKEFSKLKFEILDNGETVIPTIKSDN